MIALHPKIVYRIPCFPINGCLEDHWPELKIAIAAASPEFYVQIQDVKAADLPGLPQKISLTIWKYFNRARFRATPYGHFAAIGLFDLNDGQGQTLIVADEQQVHEFVDWEQAAVVHFDFKAIVDRDVYLQANNTYYRIGDVIRFIAKSPDGFILSEVDADEMTLKLLGQCQKRIRISQCGREQETLQYIEYLIGSQLLFTSLTPNIIGQDYFTRSNIPQPDDGSTKYIIAERKHISGSLDRRLLKSLPMAVNRLNDLNPVIENNKLKEFISRFIKKFGQNEVLVMVALDPELGVGYDDLEQSAVEDLFLESLSSEGQGNGVDSSFSLSGHLISAMLDAAGPVAGIDIQNLPLKKSIRSNPLPNTFSCLCYVSGENLVIDSLGGATANALLGRFSLASDEVHAFCRTLSDIEEKANPGILFFDLAYQSEGKVDNVSRRKSIYNIQLSIADYDTSENPLSLADLYLSVKGNEIILRSGSLNRRMVPRMASAYNFNRSDLSVFRLLCDMQHQNINSALSFSIQSIIPGLSYYPRLMFKNIVLSARKWKLENDIGPGKKTAVLQDILKSGCRFVKTGNGDQTLCFDLTDTRAMAILDSIIKKQKTVYVEEVMMSDEGNASDNSGRNYHGQLVVSLYHDKPVYLNAGSREVKHGAIETVKAFSPGSDWLYYQIFIHPSRTDELLLEEVNLLLKSFKEEITEFFFIRYDEDGSHIRLRLKIVQQPDIAAVMNRFAILLHDKLTSGLISNVRICTYYREGERYGWNRIADVEHFFFQDSWCTLALLAANVSTEMKYTYTMALMEGVLAAGLFGEDEFLDILNSVSGMLSKEHHWGPGQFRLLNEKYRADMTQSLHDNAGIYFPVTALVAAFKELMAGCPERSERRKLFADLIHMHVNRLHSTKQRMHEAVTYYFASKRLLRQRALNIKPQPLTA